MQSITLQHNNPERQFFLMFPANAQTSIKVASDITIPSKNSNDNQISSNQNIYLLKRNATWVKARLDKTLKLTDEMIANLNKSTYPEDVISFQSKLKTHHLDGIFYGRGSNKGAPVRRSFTHATQQCEKLTRITIDITSQLFALLGKSALLEKLKAHRTAISDNTDYCVKGALFYIGDFDDSHTSHIYGNITSSSSTANGIVLTIKNPIASESIQLLGVKPVNHPPNIAPDVAADFIAQLCKNQQIRFTFGDYRANRNNVKLGGIASCAGNNAQSIGAALITQGLAQVDYATLNDQASGEFKVTYLRQVVATKRMR